MGIKSHMSSSESDTDFEYEQIKAKLDAFEKIDTEVEDFEEDYYLADINSSAPILIDDSAELKEFGCVYSIVDDILIVQSTYSAILEPGTAAALPNRTAVGIIGDTFGPVETPFYSIKIADVNLKPLLISGLPILFCPNSSKSLEAKDFESSDSESEEERD